MSIYYYLILHGNQHFSEEEKQDLFKAYLINANVKSREAVKKRQQQKAAQSTALGMHSKASSLDNHVSHAMSHSGESKSSQEQGTSSPPPTVITVGNITTTIVKASPVVPHLLLSASHQVIPEEILGAEKEEEGDVEKGERIGAVEMVHNLSIPSPPVKKNTVMPI
jgi:hypothetical protein